MTVCAPAELDRSYDFIGAGAHFVPVPRRSDPAAVAVLRAACAGADLVHAHGLHAALRTSLAVGGQRRGGRPVVVTWHTRSHADGARGQLLRLVERRVARAATVVLATSSELVDRARSRGARDARFAPVSVPVPLATSGGAGRRAGADGDGPDGGGGGGSEFGEFGELGGTDCVGGKARAELGLFGRPLLMAVGSLEPHRGYGQLLDAAALWRGLDPVPLLAIAGEGRERDALQRRIEAEDLPVRLIGRRDDVTELLATADVAVLPSRWEARSLLAQEALRLGVPLVATAVGGVPELVGEAAELVPYGDVAAFAGAVAALLADPGRRAALAAAGRAQAATWPTEDETVAQVLSVYDELTRPAQTH